MGMIKMLNARSKEIQPLYMQGKICLVFSIKMIKDNPICKENMITITDRKLMVDKIFTP